MSLEGVLNIDKPQGITSHDVVNQIRRLSAVRRVGHAGTLDPLATGVLLLCLGRATRLVEYLVSLPKYYEAVIRLGQVTDTYDAEGQILEEREVLATELEIREVLRSFQGRIQQKAPAFSAIKQDGRPLYKLAREGKPVDPPLREVQIYELELLSWEKPLVQIRVSCSSGTYIRSLAHDFGQLLGPGGHICQLRRTAVGDFASDHSAALKELDEENWLEYLLSSDTAVRHLPRLDLTEEEAQRLQLGQRLPRTSRHPQAPIVRAYDGGGRFIGIVKARESAWQPHKIFPS